MEREDLRMSLMRLAHSIQKMDEESFDLLKNGMGMSIFITDSEWQLHSEGRPRFQSKELTLTIK